MRAARARQREPNLREIAESIRLWARAYGYFPIALTIDGASFSALRPMT